MSRILFLILIVSFNVSFTQQNDTIFLSKSGKVVSSRAEVDRYRLSKKINDSLFEVAEYFLNNELYLNGKFMGYSMNPDNGRYLWLNKDGIVIKEENYVNGKKHGQVVMYNGQGKIFQKWIYYDGIEDLHTCYDTAGLEMNCDDFYVAPKFNGDLSHYIANEFTFKKRCNNNFTGKILVSFVVSKTGKIKDVKIIKSSSIACIDAEAIRVIKSLPKFTPGKKQGIQSDISLVVPLDFVGE